MNYFEFYGLPLSFQVDASALRRIYLENSRKFHPDYHTLSDAAAQAEMLERATQNNEAFKTLSDPDRRMRYILEIKGLLQEETEKQSLPQDFLMEMMEINEALMELEFDFDKTLYNKALNTVEQFEKSLEQEIRPVVENWADANGQEADLQKVKEYFFKRRYLLRIQENLSKFAPTSETGD